MTVLSEQELKKRKNTSQLTELNDKNIISTLPKRVLESVLR